jgi:hypothetical protein
MRRALYVLGGLFGLFLLVLFVMFLIEAGGWIISIGITLALIGLVVLLQWLGRSTPAVAGGVPAASAWLPGWVVWSGTVGFMLLLIGFWAVRPFVDWGAEEWPETTKARGRAEVFADFRQRLLDDPIAGKTFITAVQHCTRSGDQKGQAAIKKFQEAQKARQTGWTAVSDPGATAELEAFSYLASLVAQEERCRAKVEAIWPAPPESLTKKAVSTGWWPPAGQGHVYVGLVLLVVGGWLLIKIGDFFWKAFGKFLVSLALIALGLIVAVSLGKWAVKEMGMGSMFEGLLDGSAPPEMYILFLGFLGLMGLIVVPILNSLTRRSAPTGGQNP